MNAEYISRFQSKIFFIRCSLCFSATIISELYTDLQLIAFSPLNDVNSTKIRCRPWDQWKYIISIRRTRFDKSFHWTVQIHVNRASLQVGQSFFSLSDLLHILTEVLTKISTCETIFMLNRTLIRNSGSSNATLKNDHHLSITIYIHSHHMAVDIYSRFIFPTTKIVFYVYLHQKMRCQTQNDKKQISTFS